MKENSMKNSIFITAGLLLLLTACSTTGTLQSPTGDNKISGTITRGVFEPYQIEIILDDKAYRGEWRTIEPTQEQRAAYPVSHKWHPGQVQSVLIANDGSKLDCHWITHTTTSAEGSCKFGSVEYPLILK